MVQKDWQVRTISIRFPEELAIELETVARLTKLSMNLVVTEAVRAYVAKSKKSPVYQRRASEEYERLGKSLMKKGVPWQKER